MKFHSDIPATHILLCLLFTLLLTFISFYPSLLNFGKVLIGIEDIRLFAWIFWHFEQSVQHGSNPLFSNEIFYPYGISLSTFTLSPIQGIIYVLLPSAWGFFGKITTLQVISYLLGGLFSFILIYRFTKSLLPSLFGSFVFNFSIFHFEKAIHHLNYSMAMPWVALFFIFYFEMIESNSKSRNLVLLSIALLLVGLTEITVAVMLGFIVFLDIFSRYLTLSSKKLWTPQNMVILSVSVLGSFIFHVLLSLSSVSSIFVYTLPPLPFFLGCFLIIGKENLVKFELKLKYFQLLTIVALPLLFCLAFLYLQPTYSFNSDSILINTLMYSPSIDGFVLPSSFQFISNFNIFDVKIWTSDMSSPDLFGILLTILFLFLGPLLFPLLSYLLPSASKEEIYFRNLSLLCILFSFPIIKLGDYVLFATPFFPQPLFPFLSALRVPARFMLFGLLFLSILSAFFIQRIMKLKFGTVLALAVFLIIFFQSLPAPDNFIFNQKIPNFYSDLANNSNATSIFLYPNVGYYTGLNEVYYQTIHGKNISYGILSRFPNGGNDLYNIYNQGYPSSNETISKTIEVVRALNYDLIVVQKLHCVDSSRCFNGIFEPISPDDLDPIRTVFTTNFGMPVYEDESIVVYRAR